MEAELNVQAEVERFLNSNIIIAKHLNEGLMNLSALSNKIVRDYIPTANSVSVQTALRRFHERNKSEDKCYFENIFDVLRQAKISTRDDVVKIVLDKSDSVHALLSSFVMNVKSNKGNLFRFTESDKFAIVVIDRELADIFIRTISEERIVKVADRLGQITLALPENVLSVPGVYSTLLAQLSHHGINVDEAHTCENDYLILVSESNLVDGYRLFKSLFYKARVFFEVRKK